MGRDLGVNTLVGACNQSIAFLNLCVDSTIAASPIRMLTYQADSPGNEYFYKDILSGWMEDGSWGIRVSMLDGLSLRMQNRFSPDGYRLNLTR